MKDTLIDHKEKVPILGDIPILGKLFSTTGKSKEKTELVIFLTPHVIEGDRITEEARTYLDEWERKEAQLMIEKPAKPKPKVELPKGAKKKVELPKPKKKSMWTHLFGKPSKKKKEKAPKLEAPKAEAEKVEKLEKKSTVSLGNKTPYEEYYLMIREEINNMARRQDVSGLTGEVELKFTLDKEGFLTRSPIVLNKPELKLVRAAVNCVKKVSPFPPFPKTLKKKEAEFYVVVRY